MQYNKEIQEDKEMKENEENCLSIFLPLLMPWGGAVSEAKGYGAPE